MKLRTYPNVITIGRSSLDDHCRPDKVDMIQSLMEDVLKACFGDKKELNFIYGYMDQ